MKQGRTHVNLNFVVMRIFQFHRYCDLLRNTVLWISSSLIFLP